MAPRPAVLALALIATTSAAPAAFAQDPVREIMAITENALSATRDDAKPVDIFGEEQLGTLYSADFVEAFRAGAKNPAYDGGTSPFSYDVITGGQDGCPLEDVTFTGQDQSDDGVGVAVTFKAYRCFEGEERDKVTTVGFDVVTENGRAVVDDIWTEGSDGTEASVKEMAREIGGE